MRPHSFGNLPMGKATNDDFALNFINNVESDILIQLLATSPFLSTEEINGFIKKMLTEDFDSLISVFDVRIESIYKNKPINFDQKK